MRRKTFYFETSVIRDDDDYFVQVGFDLYPGRRAVHYPADEASPAEPPEAEMFFIEHDGEDVFESMSDDEMGQLQRECWAYLQNLDEE